MSRTPTSTVARDARVAAYGIVVAAAISLAIVLGRPEAALVAAPFLVSLWMNSQSTIAVRTTGRVEADTEVIVEGDEVELRLTLALPEPERVQVRFTPAPGVELCPDETGDPGLDSWDLPPTAGTVELGVRVAAHDWGRYPFGSFAVRSSTPGSMSVTEHAPFAAPEVRVLPGRHRVGEILRPSSVHVSSGFHLARSVRSGTDFAEIRAYQPGDRVRDLNRAATARLGSAHVNHQHPELSGDVVLMLDTDRDDGGQRSETGRAVLTLSAKGAWAIAEQHLRAQDRVGILAFGSMQRWVPPTSGRFGKHQLLTALLDLGIGVNESISDRFWVHKAVGPTDTVIAFTPLWSSRPITPLARLKRSGRQVVAVVLDPTPLLPPPVDANEALGRRIWMMQREELRRELTLQHVPTVVWSGAAGLAAAVREANRLQQRHEVRR